MSVTDKTIGGAPSFDYQAITTAVSTFVKVGSGHLRRIIVTGGTAGTIDIYDNTAASGTKIAAFSSTNALMCYDIECRFSTGLTIVTSAATFITVIYA